MGYYNVSIGKMLSKLVVLLLFHLVVIAHSLNSLQQQQPPCHDEESSALLQFKQSFFLDASASLYAGAYPKLLSWKPAKGANSSCCSWDGIECDVQTGHVIGLDLSSSFLYGSINSNSSLFRLVHLQRLNLADNHFNYSQVPSSIRNFPRLTYLNLSASVFSGQVPSEVSHLSKLSSLDLSLNLDRFSGQGLLELHPSNMRSLVQNLTSLEKLHLSFVNIFSTVPNSMANLSSLTSLLLKDSGMFGEFPVRIFSLPNLKTLSVRYNPDLTGYLPEFNQTSPLISLLLASTSFSGHLPSSIEKLGSLNELDVSRCKFNGPIPASLANLTQLRSLSLSHNNFSSGSLSWVGKQTKLTLLELGNMSLTGSIPSSLGNLTELSFLSLPYNQLVGPIPSWLGNLSTLTEIELTFNKLNGSVPESLSNLVDLNLLYLQGNSLSGRLEFHMFLKLRNLTRLQLSNNKLELLTESRIISNQTVPKFRILGLAACNITEFPHFLRYQRSLEWLDLSQNRLHDQVPKWMWNTSTETLQVISISDNFLSGFEQPPVVLPWVNLLAFDLGSNMLLGPLPVPPPSITFYDVSGNKLTGEIPPLFCSLSSLKVLDLSTNRLSGMLPQCLGNFSDLKILNLGNNSFEGILPQTYTNLSNLRMIDVGKNKLQGKLPRSLVNCVMLEFLVLSNNQFTDVFPFWLGTLPKLKLLAMSRNGFYGGIRNQEKNIGFPELRILDLSHNNFTGEFPSAYLFSGISLRGITLNQSAYMKVNSNYGSGSSMLYNYHFSVMITNKGVERYYKFIQEDFAAVDLSSNKFEGKIPEFIGNLKGLRLLNVSNNILSGGIPTFLANLTLLESLDLSQNQLSGEVPPQLNQLTFLSEFDVSHNSLTGPIPSGGQLSTFVIASYEGNLGLCGYPLPNTCGNSQLLPPSSTVHENDSGFELDWKFGLAGLGSGLLVGVVLSDVVITRWPEWFIEIVGMVRLTMKRRKRPRRENGGYRN
ncbi:hypothetical protein ACE6H2_007395 [Prunus campanulata]